MHTLTKVDVTVRGWAPGILRRSGAAAAGAALVLGLLATGAPAASATTSFTLYVNQSGTSITGCASAAKACKTIAEGITAASLLSGDDVTVDVAASKTHYDENLVFGDTSNPTLTIKGAGAATTTLDGTKDGNSDVVVSFGVVTISGLAIVNGVSGDPGGGVENGATLSLPDRLTCLIEGLFKDVSAVPSLEWGWVEIPLIMLIWRRLRRMRRRIAAIVARFRAGMLPQAGTLAQAGTLPAPGTAGSGGAGSYAYAKLRRSPSSR